MKKLKPTSWIYLIFTALMLALFILLPYKSYSAREKRELSAFPQATAASVTDGSWSESVESFFADHFPLRDFFIGVNAYYKLLTGQNAASDVLQGRDGYLFAAPAAYDEGLLGRNIAAVNRFAEATGLKTSLLAVPESGWVNEDELPDSHPVYRDGELLEAIKNGLSGVDYIDFAAAAQAYTGEEPLYYRTDHHLTSRGSYLLYDTFCQARGLAKTGEALYNKEKYAGFGGTAYSSSGLWFTPKDELELWRDGGSYSVTIDDGEAHDGLFFTSHLGEEDKYPVYLDGNHALTRISNPEGSGTLLLIKDSFAHCPAVFLASNYRDIYMVDLRYYKLKVSELAESVGADEALILYGLMNITTESSLLWLS